MFSAWGNSWGSSWGGSWGFSEKPAFSGGMSFDKKQEYLRARKKKDLFDQATKQPEKLVKAKQDLNRLIEIRTDVFVDSDEDLAKIEAQRIQAAQERLRELQRKRNNDIAMSLLLD
jgi:hypothetical protein